MSGTDERELLAAEYVLGTLSPDAARQARALIESDRALAVAVQSWQVRLAPLAAAVRPVPPPPALWARIETSLAAPVNEPARLVAVQPGLRPPRANPSLIRLWRNPAAWRGATLGSLALAASFAALLVLRQPQRQVVLVASLAPLDAKTAFLAELQPGGGVVLTAIDPGNVSPGKDLELWLARPGAKPQSLGVLPSAGRRFTLAFVPPADSQLLVSLEPMGGSPTGAPTGKVLYGGRLIPLR